jgi:CheY-like chemotaxis protein
MNAAPQVLVIDDDAQVLGLFTRVLSRAGYVVTGTISGSEGMALLQRQTFDAVVLDLSMPRPDGFEILKAARRHDPTRKIVVVSGVMEGVLLKAAKLFGATAALAKPVEPEVMIETLATVLNEGALAAR